MNYQEWGHLGSIFRKHHDLDSDERELITGLVKGSERPHLPSPRSKHLGNTSLWDEIMDLRVRKEERLSMEKLKETRTTSDIDTANSTCSDPEVDTTRLSAGHPVYKLSRAKLHFEQVRKLPPFVISSRNTPPKLAILPSTDGLRPENPTRFVELVIREWDGKHSFWTMDQNGRRYIVQHFARDGGRWQTWKRRDLFSRRPLAFSPISRPRPIEEDDSETGTESSDDLGNGQAAQKYLPSGRPLRSCVDPCSVPQDASMSVDTATSAESNELPEAPGISSQSVSAASNTATFLKGEQPAELPFRGHHVKTWLALNHDAEPGPSTGAKVPPQMGITNEASGQKAESSQNQGTAVPTLANQIDTSHWHTKDTPTTSKPSGSGTPSPQFSNPAYVPVELPDKHPTEMEAKARGYYPDPKIPPPFAIHKLKERERMVVISTDTGLRPDIPTKAKIVLRDWNRRFSFWTLDLSGIRHIVKPFPGASKGGVRYNRWKGPHQNADDEWTGPIAFSDVKPKEEEHQKPLSNDLGSGRNADYSSASSESTPSEHGSEELLSMAERSRRPYALTGPRRPETMSRVEIAVPHQSSGLGNQRTVTPKSVETATVNGPPASKADDSRRKSESLKRHRQPTPPDPAKRRKTDTSSCKMSQPKKSPSHPSRQPERRERPSITKLAEV